MGMGLGLGLRLGNVAAQGGVAAPATFTMSQLPAQDAYSPFQRTTFSGGGQGKGQGSVTLSLSAVTFPGSVQARCRSEADGTTIVQAAWVAATLVATGAQTLTVTGVDARLGYFYVDLLDSSGTWQLGTVPICMGDIIAIGASQSLGERLVIGSTSDGVNTLTSMGITPNPNGRIFVKNSIYTAATSAMTWELPATGGHYDGAGVTLMLDYYIRSRGVNVSFSGYSYGGQAISYFFNGSGTDTAAMTFWKDIITRAHGKFSELIVIIGHADSSAGTTASTFKTLVKGAIDQMKAYNGMTTRAVYFTTIPHESGTYGTLASDKLIRLAGQELATAEGYAYLTMPDLDLNADRTHPTQYGGARMAVHYYRASRPLFGLGGDHVGPTISSITRASTIGGLMTVNLTMPGATGLAQAGTPVIRVAANETGDPSLPWDAGSAAITLGASSFTMVDPNPANALDFYFSANTTAGGLVGSNHMIYESTVPADETALGMFNISVGRPLTPNIAEINVAAYGNFTYNLTMSGSPAYETADTGFGQRLKAGVGVSGNFPLAPLWTMEAKILQATPSGAICAYASNNTDYIGVAADGTAYALFSSVAITTSIQVADGAPHSLRLVRSATRADLSVDGVPAGSKTTGMPAVLGKVKLINARRFYSGSALPPPAGASVDEIAIWNVALPTTYTTRTSPLAGNEAGLGAYYPLDGNGNDACTN